jgi:hypothetical protein
VAERVRNERDADRWRQRERQKCTGEQRRVDGDIRMKEGRRIYVDITRVRDTKKTERQ